MMDCRVKIIYVGGNFTELNDINYKFVKESLGKSSSENLIIWTFNNKDFVINMRNVSCIEISKIPKGR